MIIHVCVSNPLFINSTPEDLEIIDIKEDAEDNPTEFKNANEEVNAPPLVFLN